MPPWNRREFVALGVGTITAAITQNFRAATASNSKIRAAVLGIGHAHAAGKTKVLRDSLDFELVGVCEPSEELRQQYGGDSAYQGVRWLSINEVLDDASVQLIAVESGVQENLSYARQAIEAGKHIHLDKPSGNELERLRSLLSEADRRQLRGSNEVHVAVTSWDTSCHRSGPERLAGRCVFVSWHIISSDIASVARPALALFPGGMMFELGCHLIDRMVDFLGRPSKVSSFLRHDSSHNDRLADHTLAVFEYDRVLAEIYSSSQQPAGGSHRLLQIQGTNGTVTLQPIEPPTFMIDLKEAAGPYRAGPHRIEIGNNPETLRTFKKWLRLFVSNDVPHIPPSMT